MKRTSILLLTFFFCCMLPLSAENPKREFRATWIATAMGIDWPKTTIISSQQSTLTNILNKLDKSNLNAVCFQVRSLSDAMYHSSYEPWSSVLTGTRGKDPSYDPLAFVIEEAHKRGIEVHAWVNPFRYETSAGAFGVLDSIRKNHPEYILAYANGTFNGTILDPAQPEVRAYIVKVIREIVQNYDIDGVIFDDYFYPYGGTTTEDAESVKKYKPANQDEHDWRRENIDKAMKAVYDMIQEEKPWVRFGIAPSGIWTMDASAAREYGITLPSGIWGMDAYTELYCNTLEWMKGGYVDYVAPQIYWSTMASGQAFGTLSQWWSDMVKFFSDKFSDGKKVHFFASHATYQGFSVAELGKQIECNRRYDKMGASGSIFYNTSNFISTKMPDYLSTIKYAQMALPPAMDWKKTTSLAAPNNLQLVNDTLTWEHGTAERFTIYAYPKGTDKKTVFETSAYLLGVSYKPQGEDRQSFFVLEQVGNLTDITLAVRAYDRYGNEYDAAVYNEGEGDITPDPNPEPDPEIEPKQGTVSFEKIWSKTIEESGYLQTDDNNRSIAYYDGSLYISNKTAGTFYVVDATDGTKKSTKKITSTGFWQHNLRITTDGQMLLGNTVLSTNSLEVYSSKIKTGSGTKIGETAITGRSDYFYTYGDWNKEGFILALSNTGNLLKWSYLRGYLDVDTCVKHTTLPKGTSTKAIPAADGKHCYVTASKKVPTKHLIATGELVEKFGNVTPKVVDAAGLMVFMLQGHEYMVTSADNAGSFEVFEITNGLDSAIQVLDATPTLGTAANATKVVDFCVHTTEKEAFIYVIAPNNGIAAYKMTFTPTLDALEQITTQTLEPRKVMENGQVYIIRHGTKYTILGNRVL